MNKEELIEKIILKKDFSQLKKRDIEIALNKFDKPSYLDEEKIKLTRDLLRKVFSVFTSRKLLNIRNKNSEWILNKHISTRERLRHYPEVYKRIFQETNSIKKSSTKNKFDSKTLVFDLGAGINGFSYKYFPQKVNYFGVEGMNQLVSLTNYYFDKNGFEGKVIHESLFNLENIRKLILNNGFNKEKTKKFLFLFKVIDSLEMLQDNYSKTLIKELAPLADFIVVSFATRSLAKREKFRVTRRWIVEFIKENFELIDDFEIGNERYLKFKNL